MATWTEGGGRRGKAGEGGRRREKAGEGRGRRGERGYGEEGEVVSSVARQERINEWAAKARKRGNKNLASRLTAMCECRIGDESMGFGKERGQIIDYSGVLEYRSRFSVRPGRDTCSILIGTSIFLTGVFTCMGHITSLRLVLEHDAHVRWDSVYFTSNDRQIAVPD